MNHRKAIQGHMMFDILEKLLENFRRFPRRNAFFIREQFHTYADFERRIAAIGQQITAATDPGERYVGIVTYDDLETYASIFALWFLGKAYVPLNPDNPHARNREITRQTDIRTLLTSHASSEEAIGFQEDKKVIDTTATGGKDPLSGTDEAIPIESVNPDTDCYVLFTSGSTGKPKGVPISRRNLDAFVSSFIAAGYDLDEEDRFLQIYDFSFDASVHCFTVPLTVGGCAYTVPRDQIKYLAAYKLMKEQQLTFVKMPPSTLSYLQPYFGSIHLEHLRYCLLGGEAFSTQLAKRWAPCVPNAQIQNVYGPTEFTINSHIFNWKNALSKEKSSNGIVSIGKCLGDTIAIVAGKDLEPLGDNEKGELCLSGKQQTRGYWQDTDQTRNAFFEREMEGMVRRFYRTGDLVYRDSDGDYMYIGRLDSQVQIQGYRVEISEIEKHALEFLEGANVAVIPRVNEHQVTELFLFVEDVSRSVEEISLYLEKNLPAYMVPRQVIRLETFPKSAGGKINRTAMNKLIPEDAGPGNAVTGSGQSD